MSKPLDFVRISALSLVLAFAASTALASGGGGGGGGGGGSDGGGGGNERASSNSEESTPPAGFEDSTIATHRPLKHQGKEVRVPDMIIKALEREGQRTRDALTEKGRNDWDSRAGQKAKQAWDAHGAASYDVTASMQSQVVTQNPAALTAPHPAAGSIPAATADTAWRSATQTATATGNGGMAGFGTLGAPPSTGTAKALRNLAPSQ